MKFLLNVFALIGIHLDAHETHLRAVSIIHILNLQILIDFMGGKPFDQEVIGMPDHVVSIVGWGVEDDKEHWIISKYMYFFLVVERLSFSSIHL